MSPETPREAKEIFNLIKNKAKKFSKVITVICPPFVYIDSLIRLSNQHKIYIGGQDNYSEIKGPFTGEVSAKMLHYIGASYVIVGHSSRRENGENDKIVSRKVLLAARENLNVILCVGEKTRDNEGHYLHYIKHEIKESLEKFPKKLLDKIIIAYEPIWAIGKSDKEAMNSGDINEMAIYIKKIISEIYGAELGKRVPILYGGSVTNKIAENILKEGGVNGLLIGRKSLEPRTLGDILEIANGI